LFLLHSQYPEGHSSVIALDQAIMEAIQGRCWHSAYQDPDGPAYHSLHEFIKVFGAKEWTVILYSDNIHFTGNVVQCTYRHEDKATTLRIRVSFLDSFKDLGIGHTNRLQEFLSWVSQIYSLPIRHTEWDIAQNPTGIMQRQSIYLAPGQHADQGIHIDCGLYAFFMILQTVSGGAVDGFKPYGIYYTRLTLALFLAKQLPIPSISFWTTHTAQLPHHSIDSRDTISSNDIELHVDPEISTTKSSVISSIRTRTLLPRVVKRTYVSENNVSIPDGRTVYSVDLQTYVADSTISDVSLGIDSQWMAQRVKPHLVRRSVRVRFHVLTRGVVFPKRDHVASAHPWSV